MKIETTGYFHGNFITNAYGQFNLIQKTDTFWDMLRNIKGLNILI
jgi:hypothetical protein